MHSTLVRRNATLSDLVAVLREQHAAKLDVVIPAAALHSTGGMWEVTGTGPVILTADGVTTTPGRFLPTGTCDAGIAEKLAIPVAYLRRLREEHLPLYDANVNGWLQRQPDRQLLVRLLRAQDTEREGSPARCCPPGTGSWTTSTFCSPSWTASAPPAPISQSGGAT